MHLHVASLDQYIPKNASLHNKITLLKETIEKIKIEIEVDALKEYNEKGIKKFNGGIGIRCTKKYNYNEDEALKWAKSHNLCLTLDNKAFKELAKTQNFEFVKVEDTIKVTFPIKGIVLND